MEKGTGGERGKKKRRKEGKWDRQGVHKATGIRVKGVKGYKGKKGKGDKAIWRLWEPAKK